MSQRPVIITFYSYKGGVGRSLALANTAYFLALQGKKVVALDFDLEAPGLHYKFSLEHIDIPTGVLGFLVDSQAQRQVPRVGIEHLVSVNLPSGTLGSISLMPAGPIVGAIPVGESDLASACGQRGDRATTDAREGGVPLNPAYVQWLAALDIHALFERHGDEPSDGYVILTDLLDQLAGLSVDYVLIDARTGITHLGNVAINSLSDHLVVFTSCNAESLDGATSIIRAALGNRLASAPRLAVTPVISRVPTISGCGNDTEHAVAQLRSASGDVEPVLLSSEAQLEMREVVRLQGQVGIAGSPLLRDYFRLFDAIGVVDQPYDSAVLGINRRFDRDHATLDGPVPLSKRIRRRAKQGDPLLVVANGDYLPQDSNYVSLFREVLDGALAAELGDEGGTSVRDSPGSPGGNDLGERIKFLPADRIKWDLLTTQIREGVFDICQDPYFVTETRSHLLGGLKIGEISSFTLCARKGSEVLERILAIQTGQTGEGDAAPRGDLAAMLSTLREQQGYGDAITWLAGLDDTAATSACHKALSGGAPGQVAETFSDVDGLLTWLFPERLHTSTEGEAARRLVVCDHGVLTMMRNQLAGQASELVSATEVAGLNFLFPQPLNVVWAWPAEDGAWGQQIARGLLRVRESGFLSPELWGRVAQELLAVGVRPLAYDDLIDEAVLTLPPVEAFSYRPAPRPSQP